MSNKVMIQMKRETAWKKNYEALWAFVSDNHRGPTRHHIEEMHMLNWLKYNRKMLNKEKLSPERKELILRLKALISSFNRVNQYM